MNLADMRAKFRKRTSGLADAEADADVDTLLNRAYQHNIPRDIPGQATEGIWNLDVDNGAIEYAYPSHVIAPRAHGVYWKDSRAIDSDPWTNSNARFLDIETDYGAFVAFDQQNPWQDTSGEPVAILFYANTAIVHPQPDQIYRIVIPARVGPENALTSSGLDNETHAMLVVTAAAAEFLDDAEDDVGAARARSNYGEYQSLFIAQSQSMPKGRRPRRSF